MACGTTNFRREQYEGKKQKQLESIADRLLEKAAEMNSLANEIYKLVGTGRIDELAKGGNKNGRN